MYQANGKLHEVAQPRYEALPQQLSAPLAQCGPAVTKQISHVAFQHMPASSVSGCAVEFCKSQAPGRQVLGAKRRKRPQGVGRVVADERVVVGRQRLKAKPDLQERKEYMSHGSAG